MEIAEVKQKEAVTLQLTLTDKSSGDIVDVSTAIVTLYCKDTLDDSVTYQFQVDDIDIDKSLGASGILKIPLTASNLNFYATKYCILKLYYTDSNIRKVIFKINSTQSPE